MKKLYIKVRCFRLKDDDTMYPYPGNKWLIDKFYNNENINEYFSDWKKK